MAVLNPIPEPKSSFVEISISTRLARVCTCVFPGRFSRLLATLDSNFCTAFYRMQDPRSGPATGRRPSAGSPPPPSRPPATLFGIQRPSPSCSGAEPDESLESTTSELASSCGECTMLITRIVCQHSNVVGVNTAFMNDASIRRGISVSPLYVDRSRVSKVKSQKKSAWTAPARWGAGEEAALGSKE